MKAQLIEAGVGVNYVLGHWKYSVFSIVLSFVVAYLIYFFMNIQLYGPFMGSPLSLGDKLGVLGTAAGAMVHYFGSGLIGALLLVVSILQGISLAALIFTQRRNRRMDAGSVGRSGVAMVAATLGLGCVPCGTSLIIPIVTLLFSSSAAAAATVASAVVLLFALVLTVYSLYKIGLVAYKFKIAGDL